MAITFPHTVSDWTGAVFSATNALNMSGWDSTTGQKPYSQTIVGDTTKLSITSTGYLGAYTFTFPDTVLPPVTGNKIYFKTTLKIADIDTTALAASKCRTGICFYGDGATGVFVMYDPRTQQWTVRAMQNITAGHDAIYGSYGLSDIKGYAEIPTVKPVKGDSVTIEGYLDFTKTPALQVKIGGVLFYSGPATAVAVSTNYKLGIVNGNETIEVSDTTISNAVIPASPPVEGTISVAPTIHPHVSGDTIDLSTLFIVPVNIIGDLDITLNPANAGTYDAATHLIRLTSSFTGSLSVTATAKAGVNITGSPATATFQVNAAPPSGDNGHYIPDGLTVYNHPNLTALQIKFWNSKHVCNHTKAIIAFAFNLKNANDSLRRYGYTRGWRTKALYHYGKYVNNKEMTGIPFTEMTTPWYKEMGFVAGITIDSVLAGNVAP